MATLLREIPEGADVEGLDDTLALLDLKHCLLTCLFSRINPAFEIAKRQAILTTCATQDNVNSGERGYPGKLGSRNRACTGCQKLKREGMLLAHFLLDLAHWSDKVVSRVLDSSWSTWPQI
ncbi:uncharacterized protein LOC112493789 [Cephus cinctus]|uniref:Uncharacterized protein LOC112493789 n=1 Tax=Cephus cinctus TaxID=211228 RepID=A0AAJ7RA89_CEPCN|nr:uncharacterized protein LOC112493789 [Cephus cinctus]